MSAKTSIEWCDATVNFFWGCTKVSPACEHCYAEALDARFHGTVDTSQRWTKDDKKAPHWGPSASRLLRVEAARQEAFRLQRRAKKEGYRLRCLECDADLGWTKDHIPSPTLSCECGGKVEQVRRRLRVFTNSMADFFEPRRDLDKARFEALDVIRQTPDLDWMILTKRPERIRELLSRAITAHHLNTMALCGSFPNWAQRWLNGEPPANVWLGTTAENQEWADKRVPELLKAPAAVRFLSCEPLLGPIRLDQCAPYTLGGDESNPGVLNAFNAMCHHPLTVMIRPSKEGTPSGIQWVIAGGESGPHARPMHPDWARSLRDQCGEAGVPFFFKQWGEFEDTGRHGPRNGDLAVWPDGEVRVLRDGAFPSSRAAAVMRRVGKKAAGRLLDGVEYSAFPASA